MKRGKGRAVAVALTWDGARWPVRTLPRGARDFLAGAEAAPSAARLAGLFAADEVREVRVCWVPRLKGGEAALCVPFAAPGGRRVPFRAARETRFGDVLGVIYRR